MREAITSRNPGPWVSTAAVVLASSALGVWITWQAPGLTRYAHDWLIRLRGPIAVPNDIAIVAIDEQSIARYGRFPWPRSLMAKSVEAIDREDPKAIALDVIFSEPTAASEDDALVQAVRAAGNVITAAQLTEPSRWLLPFPALRDASAGIGHVNVATESDGTARELLITEADDSGKAIRSMAVETVRVGDGVSPESVTDEENAVVIGSRRVAVDSPKPARQAGFSVVSPQRMAIDYIGPAGSFAAHTFHFTDIVEGRVPAADIRDKYVLVGATAEALGDRLASPFLNFPDERGDPRRAHMPGVEVLANAVETILAGRFYREPSDMATFLLAAMTALLLSLLLNRLQGRWEMLKQIGTITGGVIVLVASAWLLASFAFVYLPMVALLVTMASASTLTLIDRSVRTSRQLDRSIARLGERAGVTAPSGFPALAVVDSAVQEISRIVNGSAAIFRLTGGRLRYAAGAFGHDLSVAPDTSMEKLRNALAGAPGERVETVVLRPSDPLRALLAMRIPENHPLPADAIPLCRALGESAVAWSAATEVPTGLLPQRSAEKTNLLDELNARLEAGSRIVTSSFASVGDGLILAAADGSITSANARAAEIFGKPERALRGQDLFGLVDGSRAGDLAALLLHGEVLERELRIERARTSFYNVRIAAVATDAGSVIGLVSSLSDVTRLHELQQTRNDVIALVSHEMRTPLTAIQGMSELLANYEIDAPRRREMNAIVNDEVKRLTRMIDDYLDIARLQSGRSPERREAIRIEPLIDRLLLLYAPIAAPKHCELIYESGVALPAVLADPDLLNRAIGNLISNAIKYSPNGAKVHVRTAADAQFLQIDVEDQGYGILPEDQEKIFDKFYRVPRVEDADTPGTGLGLAFTREIAALHGGTVAVQSALGAGSTFTFRLPIGLAL